MHPAGMLGKIRDTMRHDPATGEAGAIMIQGLEGLLAVDLAMPGERAQTVLLLGLDAHNRVPRREQRLDEMAQGAPRRGALRGVPPRQAFGALATGQPERIEQTCLHAHGVCAGPRTRRGPAQTPWACRRSGIAWGVTSLHSPSSRRGAPAIRALIVSCTCWSHAGCLASVCFRPPPGLRTRLPAGSSGHGLRSRRPSGMG